MRGQVLSRAKDLDKGRTDSKRNGYHERPVAERGEKVSSLESAERTLFAISVRSAILDTVIHVFETYGETRPWRKWEDRYDASFQYLLAIRDVVQHPEHREGLRHNQNIYDKVDELNELYKAGTVGRSMLDNFSDYFGCDKPNGLSAWKEFFDSDLFQKQGPGMLERDEDLFQ